MAFRYVANKVLKCRVGNRSCHSHSDSGTVFHGGKDKIIVRFLSPKTKPAFDGRLTQPWPIRDPANDEKVKQLAQFAVDERNKSQGSHLCIKNIKNAWVLKSGGKIYGISLEVMDDTTSQTCIADVWERRWLTYPVLAYWVNLEDECHTTENPC